MHTERPRARGRSGISKGPLAGTRVLDLTGPPGQLCAKMLADAGADVIRVEPPDGSPLRSRPPFIGGLSGPESSLYFLHYNGNKRGVTLDLDSGEGQDLFRRLARTADVLVESFSPGYLDDRGLTHESLREENPALVQTSITHFGRSGPYADYQGSDMVCFALGGVMSQAGEPGSPPITAPGELAYALASAYAAVGTNVALFRGLMTGCGQMVEVAVHEAAVHVAGYAVPIFSATGRKPFRQSWKQRLFDLYDVYPCNDGHARIFIMPRKHWRSLLDWLGHPEELGSELFEDQQLRWENSELIDPFVEGLTKSYDKAGLFEEGQRRGVTVSPLNTPREFIENEQTRERGLFRTAEHREVGEYYQLGPMHRFSGTADPPPAPAPTLGEHNREVYCGELGLAASDLLSLERAGVV